MNMTDNIKVVMLNYMLDNLKVGVLAPLSMFTQLPPMVAPERNNRRLRKSELLQHVEHPGKSFVLFSRNGAADLSPADFVIHVRDRGVVGSPQVLGLPIWDGDVGLAKVGVSKSIGGAVRESSQLCPVAPSPMGHVFGNIGVAEEKMSTSPKRFLPHKQ